MTDHDKFIAELYPTATKIAQETGMSKELILAQAALETGWGKHVLLDTHNIFNIKASADWSGPTGTFNVWEIDNEHKVWKDQEFRVYKSTEDALRDRVKFLQENPRYAKAGLFDEGTRGNFIKEAAALQRAGYATDADYAAKLVEVYHGPTMQRAIKLAQARVDGGTLDQEDRGTTMRALQLQLAGLGYTGAHGHALEPDGKFGPDTRHAVEAFQRDHQLAIDGQVGPQTRGALDALANARPGQSPPSLADPAHPDHVLFSQIRQQVQRIDADMGRVPDQHSNNLAGALTVATKQQGLSRIDEVAINEDGSRAFVAQHHTGYSTHTEVVTAEAIKIPLAQSSAAALTVQALPVACHPHAEQAQHLRPVAHTPDLMP
ncbi:MAG TPA: glucosaminidase domain-containing protein [Rhodanobacter sp.]|jgi:hypothetical protein|nr:glucosaminidase domain-containing protein [Rhodanobacter sp.]